jgi:microcystin-dependent protein
VLANGIPSGVITMWSGSIASIPSGWFLCNGANGTPDLRDRFVVGAGTTYAVGATGGSANATLVSHTHTATSAVTDPGHTHFIAADVVDSSATALTASNQVKRGDNGAVDTRYELFGTSTAATLGRTSSTTTGVSVATSVSTEGSSASGANLPPYYALAYIMKA